MPRLGFIASRTPDEDEARERSLFVEPGRIFRGIEPEGSTDTGSSDAPRGVSNTAERASLC